MITGFNSEVTFNEITFHVQTEDRGRKAGRIDTIIYRSGGVIVHRKQIFYKDILKSEVLDDAIRELMEDIHRRTLIEVRKGLWTIGAEAVPEKSFRDALAKYLLQPEKATGLR